MAVLENPATAVMQKARALVDERIVFLSQELRQVNNALHEHPETAYKEFFAHETLTAFLEKLGFQVARSTYNLETSFEATFGSGSREVVFCAEYDALPDIGHGCGHNLIATSSLASFLSAAHALSELKVPGRLRLLGTPAEEGGGGKAKLIDAGAFEPTTDIAAAMMAHPFPSPSFPSPDDSNAPPITGLAGIQLIASHKFRVEFRGKTAHAASFPSEGLNALDAAVAAYSNVSLLRQQVMSDERIHGVIEVGGTVPNVITDYTRMNWNVRSPTIERADKLLERVHACLRAGALASGCEMTLLPYVQNHLITNLLFISLSWCLTLLSLFPFAKYLFVPLLPEPRPIRICVITKHCAKCTWTRWLSWAQMSDSGRSNLSGPLIWATFRTLCPVSTACLAFLPRQTL